MYFLSKSSLPNVLALLYTVATAAAANNDIDSSTRPVPYKVQTPPLDTDWTYSVGTNPWPEHPRPQLRRHDWKNLNGIWTWQPATGGSVPDPKHLPRGSLKREVMVPSCIESGLSGIQQLDVTDMWFATTFEVPSGWRGSPVLLHFEAVDYQATVFINGVQVGSHVGGYLRFSLDITQHVHFGRRNEL